MRVAVGDSAFELLYVIAQRFQYFVQSSLVFLFECALCRAEDLVGEILETQFRFFQLPPVFLFCGFGYSVAFFGRCLYKDRKSVV